MLGDNSHENRKRGDAEAEADEQHEGQSRGILDAEPCAQEVGERGAQRKRQKHAEIARGQHDPAVGAKVSALEANAHEKHEQHDAKLAEYGKVIKSKLGQGRAARECFQELDDDGQAFLKELFLLTAKPVLYCCNVDEASVHSGNVHTEAFKKAVGSLYKQRLIILEDKGIRLVK